MLPIVTDVERVHHHSTPRSPRSARVLQRVGIPALTVVSVLTSTVFMAARPAAGDAISDAKAKAAAIEAQLTQAQNQMSALSQQYDAAQYHLSQINSSIATTKANVAADEAAGRQGQGHALQGGRGQLHLRRHRRRPEPDLQRQRADARCDRHLQQGRRGRHLPRRRQPAHGRELAERAGEPAPGRAVAGPDTGDRRAERRGAERSRPSQSQKSALSQEQGQIATAGPAAASRQRPQPPPRRPQATPAGSSGCRGSRRGSTGPSARPAPPRPP